MGPDKMHTSHMVLKEGRYGMCKLLSQCCIVTTTVYIIEERKTPSRLETSNSNINIYKGSRYDPNNYHPVSLTTQRFVKFWIICVSISTTDFLSQNKLTTQYQHGFTRGKSCLTDLHTIILSCSFKLLNLIFG